MRQRCIEEDMTWNDFHRLVRKNCGKYLRSRGDRDMRGVIEDTVRLCEAKRDVKRPVDVFFEELERKR